LIEDNKQMREALILQLKAGGGPVTLPLKAASRGDEFMRNDCAKCHDGDAKNGGKRVLFKDGVFIRTPENVADAHTAIKEGRMPKGRKWGFEEKYESLSSLVEEPEPKK
jgi:hypothetical protein